MGPDPRSFRHCNAVLWGCRQIKSWRQQSPLVWTSLPAPPRGKRKPPICPLLPTIDDIGGGLRQPKCPFLPDLSQDMLFERRMILHLCTPGLWDYQSCLLGFPTFSPFQRHEAGASINASKWLVNASATFSLKAPGLCYSHC